MHAQHSVGRRLLGGVHLGDGDAGLTDLKAALRAVTLAREVERLSEGHGAPGERQARRNRLGEVTDARIPVAMRAGATTRDIARALDVGLGRAQERVRDARKAAGEWAPLAPRGGSNDTTEPEEVVSLKLPERVIDAPNPWLDVSRCSVVLPPPAPTTAVCRLPRGHTGGHQPRPH